MIRKQDPKTVSVSRWSEHFYFLNIRLNPQHVLKQLLVQILTSSHKIRRVCFRKVNVLKTLTNN